MEHYIVLVDGKLTTCCGKNEKKAKSKALSSHPGAYSVRVLASVEDMYNLLQPFKQAGIIPTK